MRLRLNTLVVGSSCVIVLGLQEDRLGHVNITTEAIETLARWYAREAGVRNLSKLVDKVSCSVAERFLFGLRISSPKAVANSHPFSFVLGGEGY